MAPAVPRLRILSGASNNKSSTRRGSRPRRSWAGCTPPTAAHTPCPANSEHTLHHHPEHLLTAPSWRQRRFSVPLLAVAGDQRLRRHARMEVRIRQRRTVRHLVQVSSSPWFVSIHADNNSRSALYGNERFKPHSGEFAGLSLPLAPH
jgi:hypothetical protein